MAIAAADIEFHLTINTANNNSTAQGNVNDSIGGYMATTQLTDATIDNLFDDVSGDDNVGSVVDYRCEVIYNHHATLAWLTPKVWINSETAGGASVAIGLDPAGIKANNSAVAIAARPANETTAPAGVTFTAPTTKGAGLAVADVAAGSIFAYWIRRTAANTAALDTDGAVIKAEGDSAA